MPQPLGGAIPSRNQVTHLASSPPDPFARQQPPALENLRLNRAKGTLAKQSDYFFLGRIHRLRQRASTALAKDASYAPNHRDIRSIFAQIPSAWQLTHKIVGSGTQAWLGRMAGSPPRCAASSHRRATSALNLDSWCAAHHACTLRVQAPESLKPLLRHQELLLKRRESLLCD